MFIDCAKPIPPQSHFFSLEFHNFHQPTNICVLSCWLPIYVYGWGSLHHQTESSFQTRSSSVPLACFWHCYHWIGHMRSTFCWSYHQSEGVKIISNTKHMYLRGIKLGSKVVMIRTAMLKSNGALTTGTLVVFCSNYDGSLLPAAPVRCSLSLSLVTNAPFSFNARKHELSWTRNLWEGKQFLDYHIIFILWNKIAHIVMCNFSYFEMIVWNK